MNMDVETRILFLERRIAALESEASSFSERNRSDEDETPYGRIRRIRKQGEEITRP